MTKKYTIRLFRILFVALLAFYSSNTVATEIFSSVYTDSPSLKNPHVYIFVGSFEHISEDQTNSSTGTINVTDVIRGHYLKPGRITVKWHHWTEAIKLSQYKPPQIARPLKLNEKVIVFARLNEDSVAIISYLYEYSDRNRVVVTRNMAPPEWSKATMLFLFLWMVAFPGLAFVLLVLLKTSRLSQQHAKPIKVYVFLAPILTFITYLIYESGISVYSNIRIDLIIIFPIILVSFSLWLYLIFHTYIQHKKVRGE